MAEIHQTPSQAAEKWGNNLRNAGQSIQIGVGAVTESPTAKAAEQEAKYLAGVQAAVASGKWRQRLQAVSLQEWKDAMLNVGVGRISAGVNAAQGDMEDFFQQLFQHEEQLMSQVDAMPKVTLQDSKDRMLAWVDGMANFSRT